MKPWRSLLHYLPAVIILAMGMVALGYGIGAKLLPQSPQITTTTALTTTTVTSNATITSTAVSTKTITKTETSAVTATTTSTTTLTLEQPLLLHPSGPSAIIRSRIILNRSVLMIVSMDKPIYNLLNIVHFKGTATNLTPRTITLMFNFPSLRVRNSSTVVTYSGSDSVWISPESRWADVITLGPGETVTLPYFTSDWNLVGVHTEQTAGGIRVVNDLSFIPAGNYTATWYSGIDSIGVNGVDSTDSFNETANFEFNK